MGLHLLLTSEYSLTSAIQNTLHRDNTMFCCMGLSISIQVIWFLTIRLAASETQLVKNIFCKSIHILLLIRSTTLRTSCRFLYPSLHTLFTMQLLTVTTLLRFYHHHCTDAALKVLLEWLLITKIRIKLKARILVFFRHQLKCLLNL